MKPRNKVTRKANKELSPKIIHKKLDIPNFNIKFNISQDNLSCFMSSKNAIKKACRKASQSVRKTKKL